MFFMNAHGFVNFLINWSVCLIKWLLSFLVIRRHFPIQEQSFAILDEFSLAFPDDVKHFFFDAFLAAVFVWYFLHAHLQGTVRLDKG